MGKSRLFTNLIMFIATMSILAVPVLAGSFKDDKKVLNDKKITPIKGILLLCDPTKVFSTCEDRYILTYINSTKIKFLTRDHLEAVLKEQSLQQSGLTDNQKSIQIGKILGASHILLYSGGLNTEEKATLALWYQFKLVNVETSEIEYTTETYDPDDSIKKSLDPKNLRNFFKILNKHAIIN